MRTRRRPAAGRGFFLGKRVDTFGGETAVDRSIPVRSSRVLTITIFGMAFAHCSIARTVPERVLIQRDSRF